MSFTLILQDESKKTVGGYLWFFLTLAIGITTNILILDFSRSEHILNYIAVLFLFVSPLSLIFMILRPENIFFRVFLTNKKISPFFETTSDLSLSEIYTSPLLGKERDNFWGNILIAAGLTNLAVFRIPFSKFTDHPLFLFLENLLLIICIVSALLILFNWIYFQRRRFLKNIKITWRYMEMISQLEWSNYYKKQLIALEESLKLRLWKKAEYQLLEFDRIYQSELTNIHKEIHNFLFAFHFLCGETSANQNYHNFRLELFKNSFTKVRILGMQYHNDKIFETLNILINDYEHLNQLFRYNEESVTTKISLFNALIEDLLSFDKFQNKIDEINRIKDFSSHIAMVVSKEFHSAQITIQIEELQQIINFVNTTGIEKLSLWFEGVTNIDEFVVNFLGDIRDRYQQAVKTTLGDDPISEVEDRVNEIDCWLEQSLG